jgi:hypothetical protein
VLQCPAQIVGLRPGHVALDRAAWLTRPRKSDYS